MKRALIWAVVNFTVTACAVYGLFYGVKWATNIVLFTVWLTVFFNTFAAFNGEVKNNTFAKGRSVPQWLSVSNDVAVIIMLVCVGRFIAAAAAVWSTMMECAIYNPEKGVKP